jgi:hypothetical protein
MGDKSNYAAMNEAALRQYYADQTGDPRSGMAMRRDGPEGYEYSPETLRRALDAYNAMDYDYDRQRMAGLLEQFGPRMGASMGQAPIPDVGRAYASTKDALMNADQFRQGGDYGEMMRHFGNAFMSAQPQNPLTGVMGLLGAVDFMRDKYRKAGE